MEDATPKLERQLDEQDGTHAEVTTGHPVQENQPKRKPSIKKSQGRKGKNSILSTFYFRNAFSPPSLLRIG